jgi:hypothetical protein
LKKKKEYSLSKQLLKSGTLIGTNIEKAQEASHWLKLLKATNHFDKTQYRTIFSDCEERLKTIGSIQKSIHNS